MDKINAIFKPDWGTVQIKDGEIYAWRHRCKKKSIGGIRYENDRFITLDHGYVDLYTAINWWLSHYNFPIIWPDDQIK